MKRVNDEYLKIIIYAILSIILVLSAYFIIINIRHYKALSQDVMVSEADTLYTDFKNNVNGIENKLNNKNITSLTRSLNVLKDGGVFRLIPNTKLTYYDLYNLNDYFMNDIINNCWISNLKSINKDKSNEEMINVLISNSEYLEEHFTNNGLTLYDSYSETNIQNDYKLVLNNYLAFSRIILRMIEG